MKRLFVFFGKFKELSNLKKIALIIIPILLLAGLTVFFYLSYQQKNNKFTGKFTINKQDLQHISPSTKEISFSISEEISLSELREHFGIKPSIKGHLELNNKILTFKIDEQLSPNTAYVITLSKGIKTDLGSTTETDYKWYLKTTISFSLVQTTSAFSLIITNTTPFDKQTMTLLDQEIIVFFKDTESVPTIQEFSNSYQITPQTKGSFAKNQDNAISFIPEKDLLPSTTYSVSIKKGLKTKKDTLSQDYTFSFTTRSALNEWPPSFDKMLYSQISNKPFSVVLSNNGAEKKIDLNLYRINNDDLLPYIEYTRSDKVTPAPKQSPMKTWGVTIGPNSGYYVDINPLPSGSYYLTAKSGDKISNCLISVSSIGAVVHDGTAESIVWAVDYNTGKKSHLNLKFYSYSYETGKMTKVGTGETNKDGVWKGQYYYDYISASEGSNQFAMVFWRYADQKTEYIVHGRSDKTLYTPGEKLKYRIIVREDNEDKKYQEKPINYELSLLHEGNGYQSYYQKGSSPNGIISGEINLDYKFQPGSYYSVLTINGKDYAYNMDFDVSTYNKPDLKINVNSDQETYISDQEINYEGDLSFYSNQPVANAQIKYTVTAAEIDEPYGNESFWYYGFYGETKENKTITTDQNGKFKIITQTDKGTGKAKAVTLTVNYKNKGVTASSAKTVLVHAASFKLLAEPINYSLKPSNSAKIKIQALDFDNKSYDKKVEGEAKLTLKYWERKENPGKWTNKYDHYSTEEKTKDIATKKFTLDKETVMDFGKLDNGYYIVEVKATDEKSNITMRQTYLWVSDIGYNQKNERIELSLDKDKYVPGDTAKLTVNLPKNSGDVLMVLARNKIYDYKVLSYSNDMVIDIPITDNYLTNIGVSIDTYKDEEFFTNTQNINVPADSKKLKIEISPNKQFFTPGEEIEIKLKVKDYTGKGMKSNLLLSVVDQAALDLQNITQSDIYDKFYSDTGYRLGYHQSLEGFYFPGGKGGGSGRNEFKDTAYFNPNIETNNNGEASIKFKLPDNLTSWNIFVEGFTSLETKVGNANTNIYTKKNLSLRQVLPKFLYIGDSLNIKAIISNHTNNNGNFNLVSESQGVEGKINSLALSLNKAESAVKSFFVKVKNKVTVILSVKGGNDEDKVTVAIPTEKFGYGDTEIYSQKANSINNVDLSKSDLDKSNVKIIIYPSLASHIKKIYKDLSIYPYGCAEQSASKARVIMMTLKNADTLGLTNQEKKEADENIKELLAIIQGAGNKDGWGPWPAKENDPIITSYIYSTLKELQANGYKDLVQNNILAEVEKYLDGTGSLGEDQKAFIGYYYEKYKIAIDSNNLSQSGLIYYALTRIRQGDISGAKKILSQIKLEETQTTASVNVNSGEFWNEITANTAMYSLAMQRLNTPNNKSINWLLEDNNLKYVGSYGPTAAGTALLEYLKSESQKNVSLDYTIKMNDTKTESGKIINNLADPKEINLKPEKEMKIEVNKVGEGNLYYDLRVDKFLSGMGENKENGLEIERKYYVNGTETDKFKTGDLVSVILAIKRNRQGQQMIINDYLPAGLSPITEYGNDEETSKIENDNIALKEGIQEINYYDDHVAIFTDQDHIKYSARAFIEGQFQVKPAFIMLAYHPETWGRSGGKLIEVSENAAYGIINNYKGQIAKTFNPSGPKKALTNKQYLILSIVGIFLLFMGVAGAIAYKKSSKFKKFIENILIKTRTKKIQPNIDNQNQENNKE
ncbi:hypothetical protein AUK11_03340 [bacterium CG2_30_37_16]|nr:MAG: hypothetical protein AUK11_03340 [bacterium CG2_30_37_16]